jgi:hypothetical protein
MPAEWEQYPDTTKGAVGVAVADSPDGPWTKHDGNPILECSDDPDAFDSLRVDDVCIVAHEEDYWMYYKGREWDEFPGDTKMGLARAGAPAQGTRTLPRRRVRTRRRSGNRVGVMYRRSRD